MVNMTTNRDVLFGEIYKATGSDMDGSTPEEWVRQAAEPGKYALEAVKELVAEMEEAVIEYEDLEIKYDKAKDVLEDFLTFCDAWRQSPQVFVGDMAPIEGEARKIIGVSNE